MFSNGHPFTLRANELKENIIDLIYKYYEAETLASDSEKALKEINLISQKAKDRIILNLDEKIKDIN